MSVVTPPPTPDTDDRTLDERVAELEALIEEARRRTRRRRRRTAAVALAALAVAGAAFYAGGNGLRVGEARSAESDAVRAAALDRTGSWSTPTGPPGFWAWGISVDPSTPGVLYFRTDTYRVFRSANGGRSWDALPRVASRVDELVVDPRRGSTLYAGTSDGVLKSTDAGRTWRRSGLAPPPARVWNARFNGWVDDLQLDSTDSRVIYAGTRDGLYRSANAGRTWRRLLGGYSPALAILPTTPATLVAATPLSGTSSRTEIVRSIDGGRTWRTLARRDGGAGEFTVDPTRPGTIWSIWWRSGGASVLLVTRDGGATWRSPARAPAGDPHDVTVDPRRAGAVYVSTSRGVFRSADGGRTWKPFGAGRGLGGPAFDPHTPGTMYAGDDVGLVKTVDGGATWGRADAGIVASNLRAVAPAPSRVGTVYAGSDRALARSDGGGRSWTSLRAMLAAAIAVDPRDHRHLLVAGDGITESRDGGVTWRKSWHPPKNPYVNAIAFDAQDPRTVYATPRAGLLRSRDGGRSWRRVAGLPLYPLSLAVHPGRAGTIYAGGDGEQGMLYRSTDGGTSWKPDSIEGAYRIWSIAVAPSDPDTVYAATPNGVARSVDGGDHWRRKRLPGWIEPVAVAVDPRRADTVYVGTEVGGVFRSTDGGLSWKPFGKRLPSRHIPVLAFDATGTVLYAGTGGAGLTSIRVR